MINCNNYEDKIISFIENELSTEEMNDFQTELDNNPDLQKQYNEIKKVLISLNKMPKVEASANFIVNLNKKIDNYESNPKNKMGLFFNKIINYDYLPQLSMGVAGLVCLFVVTYFWNSDNSNSQIMLNNSSEISDFNNNEVAILDSTNNEENINK